MKLNRERINQYLIEITKSGSDLKKLIVENRLLPDSVELKAAKYILIELAEAISNTLQHILAKEKGIATPTINIKNGCTRSQGLNPFHG